MDSLAFAKTHQESWDRLDYLSRRRVLSGSESDEFAQLYQKTAGDLAVVRAHAPDPDLILKLSAILGRARSRLTGTTFSPIKAITTLLTVTLPLAFYRIRWWSAVVSLACVALFTAVLVTFIVNPDLLANVGTERELNNYANKAFQAYYVEYSNSDFAAMVWTNNAWIALQCVAGGVTGFFPLIVLFQNSTQVGQSGAVLYHYGSISEFFQLILPHGQLELCAIFVAGAAGLKIFWAWVNPGRRPRTEALAKEGRQTMMVGFGLILVLFISGLIEGFVTPSQLPWGVKIAIGSIALLGFWAWVIFFGRRASKRGLSADQSQKEVGWSIAYS
ncbi:putative membrane protein SpoIIM required for sporulation [Arcanobacterium pluranimalium]|uniref:stage II sporulation protein M n=1 Tax=Arcanobacterium pluranimalium TaxID=108028 RepID=UPI00195A1EA5|nr:putative membrane protein SpoIIM required for sporulation [Arcanobacterium pluranimalium]